jgi:uncharacterized protein (TIGR03084 family)
VADLLGLIADLAAETADLDATVAALPEQDWARPTPAAGWTLAHQIGHLAWTDDVALASFDGYIDRAAAERAAQPSAELLAGWRVGHAALVTALASVPGGTKLPWFGPPMSAASMATARLMETWAHGQDVADTLGITRTPTARLRHVAHIGVRTRDFAYLVNDLPVPVEPFRVELSGPDGELWMWGPADAAQRVTGAALDFCLLVTQRRHWADLDVRADGSDAAEWLSIAQAFAGPPGPGREPDRATSRGLGPQQVAQSGGAAR